MRWNYKTRGAGELRGKVGVCLCCHPEETACLAPVAEEILESQDCAIWYGDPAAHLDGEYRTKLEGMRLIVLAVTEKLLTTPNPAMDEVVPFALERHIPVLPILREENLELYALESFGPIRKLDVNEGEWVGETPYQEKLKGILSALLADGVWEQSALRKAAEAGEASAWDRLAVLYDMGVGVERDPEAALAAREEAAKLYRAACQAAPEDPERNRQLLETLEAVEELQDELGCPYEEERRYMETLRELERVCRRGAEQFGQSWAKERLYQCLMRMAVEYEAQDKWKKSAQYCRMALELARSLAEESGDPAQRLRESDCHRALGRARFNGGEDGYGEYEEALVLDQCLADKLGENTAVLKSLAQDYQDLGNWEKRRENRDLRVLYYRKWVEVLARLAEKTGAGGDRTALCYARARLATVIPEKEACQQLELAMEEGRRLAEETDRTLDWLTLADLYQIRGNFFYFYEEDAVVKAWYGKAEEIFERLVKRGRPNMVYRAWLSACAHTVESLEEDDEELEEKLERIRALCGSADL